MSTYTAEDAQLMVASAKRNLTRTHQLFNEGYYLRKNIPIQSVYNGLVMEHASIGRSYQLAGKPLNEVRLHYALACKYVIKNFKMAYDETDEDYVGDQPDKVEWYTVSELHGRDGFHYAMIAADLDLGREMAYWWRDSGDGDLDEDFINRYTHALKHAMLGEAEEGKELLYLNIEAFDKKQPKQGYKQNYQAMSICLYGILDEDALAYNRGLELVCEVHRKSIRADDLYETDEEYISDEAVALANLGIYYGLPLTLEHEYLPETMLMKQEEVDLPSQFVDLVPPKLGEGVTF